MRTYSIAQRTLLSVLWWPKCQGKLEKEYMYICNWFTSDSQQKLTHHCKPTAAAKSVQSYLTLCDPIDGSPPGSAVPGILQAGTLEWVAISFSSAWKWKVKVKSLSRVWLFATPWTVPQQAPPSMGFSRQEYWRGLPMPSLVNQLYFNKN